MSVLTDSQGGDKSKIKHFFNNHPAFSSMFPIIFHLVPSNCNGLLKPVASLQTGLSFVHAFGMPRYEIRHSSEVRRLQQWAIHYLRSSSSAKPFTSMSLNAPWSYSIFFFFFSPVTTLYAWQNFKLIISHNASHHNEPELYLTFLLDFVYNEDKDSLYFLLCSTAPALYLYNHWHSRSVSCLKLG